MVATLGNVAALAVLALYCPLYLLPRLPHNPAFRYNSVAHAAIS